MIYDAIEYYPTPAEVIERMIGTQDYTGKTVLEPSAGTGAIVDALKAKGAEVLSCEIDEDFAPYLGSKSKLIAKDFLKVTSDQISHVSAIVMNPPFSKAVTHILHAYDIAPPGCSIIALCNSSNLKNLYTEERKRLAGIVSERGSSEELGKCFSTASRSTEVEVSLIRIQKAGDNYEQEFEGFFMEEDQEAQANGLIQYNVVRDLVNRYVACIKIFDQQLETAAQLGELEANYFDAGLENLSISINRGQIPVQRNEFKKNMQRQGWRWLFAKLNMQKYATQGLMEDINKFIETQQHIPFTMRNIYHMIEIVIGTQGARMDKALLEVFEKITSYSDDNRYNLPGWKTNSHYMVTRRFIMPRLTEVGYDGKVSANYSQNFRLVEDLVKALCHMTGTAYEDIPELRNVFNYRYWVKDKEGKFVKKDGGFYCDHKEENLSWQIQNDPSKNIYFWPVNWGEWFEWGFFRVRCYKKGTIHFEFLSEDVWAQFNQKIAKMKGYPLPEKKEQTKYQERQTGRKATEGMAYKAKGGTVLETIKF